jgi:hypothetical protein
LAAAAAFCAVNMEKTCGIQIINGNENKKHCKRKGIGFENFSCRK